MSRAGAEARARLLREALLDHGVPKVSIELQQGRPGTPNSRWYDTRFIGSMGHHIVSRRSQGLTPGLSLIKRGRSDVPGPLCNGYGGFDRVARIICMGWANHPGAGGPYTLPSGRIPASNGRPYLFGWEHEGGLVLADWTDEMRAFMGSCHAGTLDWLGLRDTSHIEHSTWTDRKIDRLKYTLASARAEIRDNWEAGDGMDLNDNLDSDGTRRTMSPMARKLIPDSWGTFPAQLLGYAAAGLAWMRNGDALSRKVWRWRGLDYVNDKPNSKDHQIARAHEYSFEGLKLGRRIDSKLETLLDAQQGMDAAAIKQRIDARADAIEAQITADAQRREEIAEQAQTERGAILDLVEQVGSGDLSAEEFVDAVARRLSGDQDDDA